MNIFNNEKRAILGLSLGHFSIDLYAALLVPLYPLITTKLNINLAYISAIIAFGHLVSSMMQPLFGFIADKLKHRVFMVWGLIFSATFIPLAVKATNVTLFLACLLLGMIGNAFFHPQVSALVKDFNKNNPDLSKDMGIFLGLGTIGYAIGPYISTFFVEHFGQNSLLYLIIPGILSGFMISFTLSLDDFVITQYLKEPSFETISTYIQKIIAKHPIPPEVRALTTLIFLGVLVVVVGNTIYNNRKAKNVISKRRRGV